MRLDWNPPLTQVQTVLGDSIVNGFLDAEESPTRPWLVFIHGGAAHAHWWSPLAASFESTHRCFAPDLLGHGGSSWTTEYTLQSWAAALDAQFSALGIQNATLVAHSMGGRIALELAASYPNRCQKLILVDCSVPDEQTLAAAWVPPPHFETSVYPSAAEAIARFRLIPRQPPGQPDYMAHIAQHGLKEVPGGFVWKFDPNIIRVGTRADAAAALKRAMQPIVHIVGEKSALTTPTVRAHMQSLKPHTEFVLSGLHHHLFVEDPERFVTTLKPLL